MNGKEKCRILREIRKQIALENDIRLVTEECTFKGECRGTCPKCESEVRYLEQQLEKRRSLNKKIALAGISAGLTLTMAGCAVIESIFDPDVITGIVPAPTEEVMLMGDVAFEEPIDGEIEPFDGIDEPTEE